MDPNETLRLLRQHAQTVIHGLESDDGNETEFAEAAGHLASHFWALDQWLSRGGFLPDQWVARSLA